MKIVIIDDELNIRNLIATHLNMEGYQTYCAIDGNQGIKLIEKEKPDIVLLDIMLPDMSGFEVLQKIHNIDSSIPIIFITALDKSSNKILGLELGADDYITKPFDSKELVSRVKALYRRIYLMKEDVMKDNDILKFNYIEINPLTHTVYLEGQKIEFTFKEFNILYFLASNEKQVFTRDQLIYQVWGTDYVGNTRAVDVLITRIRRKLDKYESYVMSVYGVGYKFEELYEENFEV